MTYRRLPVLSLCGHCRAPLTYGETLTVRVGRTEHRPVCLGCANRILEAEREVFR